jgi:NRPS condensation-like uncharacterized protein
VPCPDVARLTPLEIAVLASDRPSWQPVLHLEAVIAQPVVPLHDAVATAMSTHPVARSVVSRGRRPRWRDVGAAEAASVVTVNVARPTHDVRRRLLGLRLDPRAEPAWRLAAWPDPDGGTRLLLVAHHALFDGRGALQLLAEVMAAASGVATFPDHRVDDLTERRRVVAPRAATRRAALGRRVEPLSPGAPRAGTAGQDALLMTLEEVETSRVVRHRANGITVNDLLVAAVHVAVAQWNAEHDRPADALGVTVPVESWPFDVPRPVGLCALQAPTVSLAADRADHQRLVDVIAAQMSVAKAGAIGEPAAVLGRLPLSLARVAMRAGSTLTRDRLLLTIRLSNLGRADDVLAPVNGGIRHLWFSPPARRPQWATIGVLTFTGRLHLGLRWDTSAADETDARKLMNHLVSAIVALASAVG